MKKYFKIIWILLLFSACEEPVDWQLDDAITPRLVVEAMLTNQPGLNYVKLSLPVRNPNRAPQSVSDAIVAFFDGDDYHVLSEDPNKPGLYLANPSLRGVINRVYWLYIRLGEYEFAAGAYMVPVSPLKEFIYFEDPGKPGYYRIYPRESDTPAYTEYRVEWEESDGQSNHSVFYAYKLSTLDVNQFFRPDAETLSFPAGSRIIRTKYSLSPDHERYLRSLLSETDWRGGWFDVMHGNLHTNLNNGAVGFFAASSVVRDTVCFD
ncbi:MAG: DUF4249 domain-containing protein [Bacteroidales bacterium]|nr:DUF4249 domain-containing protein [Bacteroidales bacterium]